MRAHNLKSHKKISMICVDKSSFPTFFYIIQFFLKIKENVFFFEIFKIFKCCYIRSLTFFFMLLVSSFFFCFLSYFWLFALLKSVFFSCLILDFKEKVIFQNFFMFKFCSDLLLNIKQNFDYTQNFKTATSDIFFLILIK